MIKEIQKSTAHGIIKAPPSKSMAHRYIICAALSDGVSTITNVDYSEDIKATIDCIKSLGAKVEISETSVIIDGSNSIFNMSNKSDISEIDFMCRESGSTMRFFMGIAMTLPAVSNFFGSETLRNRPFGIYEKILGNNFKKCEDKIVINGPISGNDFEIAGNAVFFASMCGIFGRLGHTDETLNSNTVTIRDRDTMEQVTIKLDELINYIEERIKF